MEKLQEGQNDLAEGIRGSSTGMGRCNVYFRLVSPLFQLVSRLVTGGRRQVRVCAMPGLDVGLERKAARDTAERRVVEDSAEVGRRRP